MAAVNRVLREVARATTRETAMAAALATIREGFGWAYGSYWAVDAEQRALHLRPGVRQRRGRVPAGHPGRLLPGGRRPLRPRLASPRPGLRRGPRPGHRLRARPRGPAGGREVRRLPADHGRRPGRRHHGLLRHHDPDALATGRADALRNTAFLLGQAMERFAAAERLERAGRELLESITEVERNVAVGDVGRRRRQAARRGGQRAGRRAGRVQRRHRQGRQGHPRHRRPDQPAGAQRHHRGRPRRGGRAAGFAVVANEVKELAAETARATTDVDAKVTAIQEQVERVVTRPGARSAPSSRASTRRSR